MVIFRSLCEIKKPLRSVGSKGGVCTFVQVWESAHKITKQGRVRERALRKNTFFLLFFLFMYLFLFFNQNRIAMFRTRMSRPTQKLTDGVVPSVS